MGSLTPSKSESASVLAAYQLRLNSPDILPQGGLRRNTGDYVLISYINNITGLLLSGNTNAVPLFISRAADHMQSNPPTPGSKPYYDLAYRYLCHVAYHVTNVEKVKSTGVEIPAQIAAAGPQRDP